MTVQQQYRAVGKRRYRDPDHTGSQCQQTIDAPLNLVFISQHCDEVGGPHASACDNGCEGHPYPAPAAFAFPRPTEHLNGFKADEHAHKGRYNDQTPVVLNGDTTENLKHR